MQCKPEGANLLDAIGDFLMKEVLPAVKSDDFKAYKTLVSWNMLGIVAREIRHGEAAIDAELTGLAALLSDSSAQVCQNFPEKSEKTAVLNDQLAAAIRTSESIKTSDAIWQHVKTTLVDDLRIANPRFALTEDKIEREQATPATLQKEAI